MIFLKILKIQQQQQQHDDDDDDKRNFKSVEWFCANSCSVNKNFFSFIAQTNMAIHDLVQFLQVKFTN